MKQALSLLILAALTACGGGGSDEPDVEVAGPPVPLQCIARDADPVRETSLERECMARLGMPQ